MAITECGHVSSLHITSFASLAMRLGTGHRPIVYQTHCTRHSRAKALLPACAHSKVVVLASQQDGERGGWVARHQEFIRAAPLVAGGLGVAGVVLNRTFSGAVGLDASSTESRTDVLIIVLSAVLLLTGLQWLALRPVEKEPVALDGMEMQYKLHSLPAKAAQELEWAWESLQAATRCRGVVVIFRGTCIYHYGIGNRAAESGNAAAGPICQKAMASGQGNYLANLALYPGRYEFTTYLPPNTQGVVVQPIGKDGVLVAATDTQRGFGRLDQAWIALLADKLDSTLEGFVPAGQGFKEAAIRR